MLLVAENISAQNEDAITLILEEAWGHDHLCFCHQLNISAVPTVNPTNTCANKAMRQVKC